MKLSKILASSCRREILKVLADLGEVNIMALVRSVNSTYNEVNRNLNILETEGILTEHRTKNRRVIQLDFENQKTKAILGVLKALEKANNGKRHRKNLQHGISWKRSCDVKEIT